MVAARCPFCGSDELLEFHYAHLTVYIRCDGCDARGPYGEDEPAAWAAWDRRPEEERLKKVAEQISRMK